MQTAHVLGLPLSVVSLEQTLREIDRRIATGEPGMIVTANLNYAMETAKDARLRQINARAFLVLADGMPLVWASRLTKTPLSQRVAGADLTPAICRQAANQGHRVFLLGAADGVALKAAENLRQAFPGLNIVGVESPPYRQLAPEETSALARRIRQAAPDILLVAFGQPKGELWLDEHLGTLGIPVTMQVGASLDFIAGTILRAPRFLQDSGLEWAYRLYLEPRRLTKRYAANGLFFMRALAGQVWRTICVRGG